MNKLVAYNNYFNFLQKELLNELHIGVSTEFFNKLWNEFDQNRNGELDYEEFSALMNRLLFKKELITYFQVPDKNF